MEIALACYVGAGLVFAAVLFAHATRYFGSFYEAAEVANPKVAEAFSEHRWVLVVVAVVACVLTWPLLLAALVTSSR